MKTKTVIPFLLISLLLAAFVAPLASSFPDGLEKVAEVLGFDHRALGDPILSSPLPDYAIPGLKGNPASTSIAGVIGTLICFFVPFGFYILRKK